MVYLDVDRLKGILDGHDERFVPHRIQLFVNRFGLVQQPTSNLKLDVRIARSTLVHRDQIVPTNQMYPQLKEGVLPQDGLPSPLRILPNSTRNNPESARARHIVANEFRHQPTPAGSGNHARHQLDVRLGRGHFEAGPLGTH